MGGSISRSINDDPFQIGGDNNTTNTAESPANVDKSAANVLLSVDTAVASGSCSAVREAVKNHIEKGEASQNMITQMKNFEDTTGAEGLSEIKKRPYKDCIIVCSYDKDSGIVLPVKRDDSNKQLVIRFCKPVNQYDNKCTITLFLKDDNSKVFKKYKKYSNTNIVLQPGEIINFTNSVYNKDASVSIIFKDNNQNMNGTIKIKTNGGYYNDLYNAEYKIFPSDRVSKNINPLSPKLADCIGCHTNYEAKKTTFFSGHKNEETENQDFMYKYCPDSGTVCIKQCLVCGKEGIDTLVETPVGKDDHIDQSEDPEEAKISDIFSQTEYKKVSGDAGGERVNQYQFNCKDGFGTDNIEDMDKSGIQFSKYFKLINIQEGDTSNDHAVSAFEQINSKIKFDNVIESKNGVLSYKTVNSGNSNGNNSSQTTTEPIGNSLKYADASSGKQYNLIIFDCNLADNKINVNDLTISENKPFIFLVKNGDNYNLLIPKSQKINNLFCIDTWPKESLSDHSRQDVHQVVQNKKDAATQIQALARGKAARRIAATKRQAVTSIQAAARERAVRRQAAARQAAARQAAITRVQDTASSRNTINPMLRRVRRGGFLSHHNRVEFAKYNVAVTKEVLRRAKIRLSQARRLKKSTRTLKRAVALAQQAHDQTQKELRKII